ncbi:MAG: amidohydrolase family protein, partial [Candidatus Zixiibacteriota bacterium]
IRSEPIVFEADDELSLLRAAAIADEFKLTLVYVGSGYEYARLDQIRSLGATLILPVNYPKTPSVKTLEDELDVSLAELRHWEAAPSNPARLAEARVKFALTTHGLKKKDTFWSNLRKAVKRGLPQKTALAALTTVPAELLGVSDLAGSVTKGKLANLVVTDGDIFDKESKILSVWIGGKEHEIEDEPPRDVRGTYEFSLSGEKFKLELEGKVEKLKGTLSFASIDSAEAKLKKPSIDQDHLQFTVELDTLGFDGSYRFSARAEDDTLFGRCALADGAYASWTAPKVAAYDPDAKKDETSEEEDSSAPEDSGDKKEPKTAAELAEDSESKKGEDDKSDEEEKIVGHLTYPNVAFGFGETPARENVLVRNATVWTCDKQGILEGADILIRNGKIAEVGKDIQAPSGFRVINAAGKHVTPGIIDEHSHIAISKGVNECTESITAEVRIGDVVNSDDITIYRQLAGGVTCSQLLHGSCNPIGGQAQVIKLRWGAAPEGLKFRAAPPTIKCALGENVKRSN